MAGDNGNGASNRTLVAVVENEPGVLNRIASLFRRRNFNIESLTVGHTETPEISRMTIVVDTTKTNAALVEKNLYKLVNVIRVDDISDKPAIMRDLVLIKVAVDAATRAEVLQFASIYDARVVDVTADTLILELSASESKVDSLVELLRPYGILEMVRTGRVALTRGNETLMTAEERDHSAYRPVSKNGRQPLSAGALEREGV